MNRVRKFEPRARIGIAAVVVWHVANTLAEISCAAASDPFYRT